MKEEEEEEEEERDLINDLKKRIQFEFSRILLLLLPLLLLPHSREIQPAPSP